MTTVGLWYIALDNVFRLGRAGRPRPAANLAERSCFTKKNNSAQADNIKTKRKGISPRHLERSRDQGGSERRAAVGKSAMPVLTK